MDRILFLMVNGNFGGIVTFLPNFSAWGQYMLDFLIIFSIANLVWGFVLWLAHSIKFLDFLMRIGRSVLIFLAVYVICNVLHLGLW